MERRAYFVSFAIGIAILISPGLTGAQTPLISGLGGNAGYGPNGQCLSPNDDGSSRAINITPYFPSGLRFFDRTHTQLYLNTNGNITFSNPVSQYTPEAFPIADEPMIAPFWGDVDIRQTGGSCMGGAGVTCDICEPCHNPTENGVWWYGESGRMIFTWDRVGHYSCENGQRNSFQLILTEVAGCGGAGDFDVEFRYNRCEWEVGSASGDYNDDGRCTDADVDPFWGDECVPAQAGFDAGNMRDFVSIMGSLTRGIHTRLCTMSNVGEPGVWRFQIRSGSVVCPDAGAECDTGLQGVCASGRTNCVGTGTECVQDVSPSAERCDALDNDCDGSVDESPESLCPTGQVCESGTCLSPCFEAGCPTGQVCLANGRCIDAGCEDVTCPAGERCEAGACVGACEGVVCPHGQTCRGGLCVDLCEGLTCDDCTACEDGICVPRCQFTSCPAGESCTEDGRCIETACMGVTCEPGTFCQGGTCVDACTGAACPQGSECVMGECVPMRMPEPTPDAGVAPTPDAGPIGGLDAGGNNGEPDAGRLTGPAPRGATCACSSATGTGGRSGAALLFIAGLLGIVALRRRAR